MTPRSTGHLAGPARRGALSAALLLALGATLSAGACRRGGGEVSEEPDAAPVLDTSETVDSQRVCQDGCRRLDRCAPELARGQVEGDPVLLASRIGDPEACDASCSEFDDTRVSLGLRDCLALSSCDAYWGCLSTELARPWLAAVAPPGERSCENLCSQASACAIAELCEDTRGESSGRRRARTRDSDDDSLTPPSKASEDEAAAAEDAPSPSPACQAETARQAELEESCRLKCEASPEGGRARFELLGCLDHGSCGGMLGCLDSWSRTDYSRAALMTEAGTELPEGVDPGPGLDPVCDAFCTRALACGAAAEGLELEGEALTELKHALTSTYVECALSCAKDQKSAAATKAFEACTAVESCEAFAVCSDEV